jgi:hypothetical protein
LDEMVEPKEAPVQKPAKDMFDPKSFLAKVGAGKQVLEFHKNQHVFEQGDVANAGSDVTASLRMSAVDHSRHFDRGPATSGLPR